MKKIMIIDDSALMRRRLSDIINSTNEYFVEYAAADGIEGLRLAKAHRDIVAIFSDLHMPKMNGIEFLEALKKDNITIPVYIVSSRNDEQDTIKALELGALDFLQKPELMVMKNDSFERKIKLALVMADSCKNINESAILSAVDEPETKETVRYVNEPKLKDKACKRLVALVCSTGGPRALQYVLPYLPKNLDAPVVIVQHMPVGFTKTLAERMNTISEIGVKEAEDNDILEKGMVYIARGGMHLTLASQGDKTKIVFDDSPAVVGLKPCGNLMYKSIKKLPYDEIVCVVLTGMGADGTKGITELSKVKKCFVIAQDEETSTVYGMPKAIAESGLVDRVCGIKQIPKEIVKKVGVR